MTSEQPVAVDRQCSVCGATVAAFDQIMCCHCHEIPWKRTRPAPSPDVAELVERLLDPSRADQTYANATDRAEAAATIAELEVEVGRLRERGTKAVIAYHVAICSPKGVVPNDEFYDPAIAARVERESIKARATLAKLGERNG